MSKCAWCNPTSSFITSLILYGATAALFSINLKRQRQKLTINAASDGAQESNSLNVPTDLLSNKDGKYNEEVKLAVDLALKAGKNMVEHYQTKGTINEDSKSLGDISFKTAGNDFCTAVDILNEKIIANAIRDKFPSHVIIGEESTGTDKPETLTDAPTWIIDPIDGTTNFASGLPLTCVSIGMCDGGIPVMGVVYSPPTEELYVAIKGRGAYRNNVRIRPRSSDDVVDLSRAAVCFEFGYESGEEGIETMLAAVRRLLNHGCKCLRSLGSGVLDLCYVASGRLDVVYTGLAGEGWKPWDYCAGLVVVEESGGVIRSLFGRPGGSIEEEFDKDGCIVEGSRFDIYSDSMICGVNKGVVEHCRRVVLGL